jgi:hypothetical protein
MMTFADGPVYSFGESEIIGIDDEPAHGGSLTGEIVGRGVDILRR